MTPRPAVRAGAFYPAGPEPCRRAAEKLLAAAELPVDLPVWLAGGLLPHAGWAYSGQLAAMTLRALLDRHDPPETLVLFGADHTGSVRLGEVYPEGAWASPLGNLAVDAELARALLEGPAGADLLRTNPDAHAAEHSLEVQVPLIAALRPATKILPIAVPPLDKAVAIGRYVGEQARRARTCIVGSTDLTHHGGHFGHVGGRGEQSEAYARQNDRRMLDRIEAFDAEGVLEEARTRQNACGAGAIAATLAAVKALGANVARELAYTNSYAVIHAQAPYELDDTTVGYAAVVFGSDEHPFA